MAHDPLSKTNANGFLYICYGGEHKLTIEAQEHSSWINQGVCLRGETDTTLPVSTLPPIRDYQTFKEDGVSWSIMSPAKDATESVREFQLWAVTEFTSPAYKIDVSLGHHRLKFNEVSGNEQFQVIEYGEETTLKAREVSYYTNAHMTFAAKWKRGEDDVQDAIPDADGWVTSFFFKPDTPQIHAFNLTVPSLYYESGYFRHEVPVHALALTPWNNNATLQTNGKAVIATSDAGVVCTRGISNILKLSNSDKLLKDTLLTLTSGSELTGLGIEIPDLNVARPLLAEEMSWAIDSSANNGKSGWFKLELACSKLKRNWVLTARAISANLADEVTSIKVGSDSVTPLGPLFYRDTTTTLSLTFEHWMSGLTIQLQESALSELDTVFDPPLLTPVVIPEDLKVSWQITAGKKSGFLNLQAVCPHTEVPLALKSRVISQTLADEVACIEVASQPVLENRAIFRREKQLPLVLTFEPWMVDLVMTLEEQGAEGLGMAYSPLLNIPTPVPDNFQLAWNVTGADNSGLFTLRLACASTKTPLIVASRIISDILGREIDSITVRDRPVSEAGALFFREEMADLKFNFKPGMQGVAVSLDAQGPPVGTKFVPPLQNPINVPQNLTLGWSVSGGTANGAFSLTLNCLDAPTVLRIESRVISRLTPDEFQSIKLNGVPANLKSPDLIFFHADSYILELEAAPGGSLPGMKVALLAGEHNPEQGTEYEPPLDKANAQVIPSTGTLKWSITAGNVSGFFDLVFLFLDSEEQYFLPCRLLSKDLSDEGRVSFDGMDSNANATSHACLGGTHELKFLPNAQSALAGLSMQLVWSGTTAEDLDVTVHPSLDKEVQIEVAGASWELDCASSRQAGVFSLQWRIPALNLQLPPIPFLLGYYRFKVQARREASIYPVVEKNQSAWVGIRVFSPDTLNPLVGIPVSWKENADSAVVNVPTRPDGWSCYAYQPKTASPAKQPVLASLTNVYDGRKLEETLDVEPLPTDPWKDITLQWKNEPGVPIGTTTFYPRRGEQGEYKILSKVPESLGKDKIRLGWAGTLPSQLDVKVLPALGLRRELSPGGLPWQFTFGDVRDGSFQLFAGVDKLLELSSDNSMSLGAPREPEGD